MPMIANGDGTFTLGKYDVWGILQDTSTGRFHACLWLESPLPGPYEEPTTFVRLKSKMHHTVGAATFEEAVEHVKELLKKFKLDDDNVWVHRSQVVERDFSNEGYADVCTLPNWKKAS